MFTRPLLPSLHKCRQSIRIQLGRAKEVHVIGHNDIAPDCKVVPLVCSAPLIGKNFCNLPRGKDSPAFKRARRYEVDRPIDPKPAQVGVDVCASWSRRTLDPILRNRHHRCRLQPPCRTRIYVRHAGELHVAVLSLCRGKAVLPVSLIYRET